MDRLPVLRHFGTVFFLASDFFVHANPSQAFVDKLLEFLDLHVSARRGRVRPPVIVPECVPAALRELGLPDPWRVGRTRS